mmetsp:Transcript_892/g.2118  ORF Transcript_892/g.2118 Transcript_892/m.2118 type:complete len:263 (+) Transcript_892:223-1011(+)
MILLLEERAGLLNDAARYLRPVPEGEPDRHERADLAGRTNGTYGPEARREATRGRHVDRRRRTRLGLGPRRPGPRRRVARTKAIAAAELRRARGGQPCAPERLRPLDLRRRLERIVEFLHEVRGLRFRGRVEELVAQHRTLGQDFVPAPQRTILRPQHRDLPLHRHLALGIRRGLRAKTRFGLALVVARQDVGVALGDVAGILQRVVLWCQIASICLVLLLDAVAERPSRDAGLRGLVVHGLVVRDLRRGAHAAKHQVVVFL